MSLNHYSRLYSSAPQLNRKRDLNILLRRLTASLRFLLLLFRQLQLWQDIRYYQIVWSRWFIFSLSSCRFLLVSQTLDDSAKLRNNHCRLIKPANKINSSDIQSSVYYCHAIIILFWINIHQVHKLKLPSQIFWGL